MINTTQKIIKIGSSDGVIIPAKELKRNGITTGDMVDIKLKRHTASISKVKDLTAEYEAFKKQYGATLKNLAKR